jgi:hypothetical protein
MSKLLYCKNINGNVTRFAYVKDGESCSVSFSAPEDAPWIEYWPLDLSKTAGLVPTTEAEVIAAFQEAWPKYFERFPAALRPAGLVPTICPCGCGEPAKPGRMYASPKLCKVRACRKKPKDQVPVVAPATSQAYDCEEVVVDLGWFALKYHRAVGSGLWYVTRQVDDGQKVATSEGFIMLNNYLQVAHENDVFDCCLQLIECILIVDYRGQDYHKALWNVMQHFALYPSKKLVLADKKAAWIATSKKRVAMAEKYLPVTHGNVEAFMAVLQGKEVAKKAKPADEVKDQDMVGLLAKRILRAIKDGCADNRGKLYEHCRRWGMWPGYGRDLDLAIKQLANKGKLKPLKEMSLTNRVIQFMADNEFTPMEIAVGLAIEKINFPNLRSTINILFLKGELGRRIVPGKDGYSYARSAYYKENGIDYLK